MDNPSNSAQDGKSHGVNILIGLAFCIFLYIALSGPAVRLLNSSPQPVQEVIVFLYTPLAELDLKIPGRPIENYVNLWINK
jgi:hypothetical protein